MNTIYSANTVVKVKENVYQELIKAGYDELSAESMKRFIGTTHVVNGVFQDENNQITMLISSEWCCHVPITAVEVCKPD
jgi:hypothetical protein